MRDNIFAKSADLIDFTFDKKVAEVFDDMVRRSVPGYQSVIESIGLIVKRYAQNKTRYYDLGASTGATSIALGLYSPYPENLIIAIDNAQAMVEKCQQNLKGVIPNLKVLCADINKINIENASIIILNLTLQFIHPQQRQSLIDKIYQGLVPNGALVIVEKIHFNDIHQQEQMTQLHLDFKRANGYSELEISAKRQSIENVLITDTSSIHLQRLENAGFTNSTCYFQCFNFVSFLAIK
jgi:tRNA (cmo5U34)-methyltransferase